MVRLHALLTAVFLLTAAAIQPAAAEIAKPYSGTKTVETDRPFMPFVKAVRAAIKERGFNIVGIACATCAAKSEGVAVPGNRVFLFFKPAYAVRMLAASEAAGIEAPIRIYVTENAGGEAEVTYRLPSHVFGAYKVPALDELGAELDQEVAAILAIAHSASGG